MKGFFETLHRSGGLVLALRGRVGSAREGRRAVREQSRRTRCAGWPERSPGKNRVLCRALKVGDPRGRALRSGPWAESLEALQEDHSGKGTVATGVWEAKVGMGGRDGGRRSQAERAHGKT